MYVSRRRRGREGIDIGVEGGKKYERREDGRAKEGLEGRS